MPDACTVAFDVTPLVGNRTGIGAYVELLQAALERRATRPVVELHPYVLSSRAASLPPGAVRLPVPARFARSAWAGAAAVPVDLALGRSAVVHATNFLAPPTRHPVVVTVHDTGPLTAPDPVGEAVRRSVHKGAWVHTPTEAVAAEVRSLLATERVVAVHHGPPPPPRPAGPLPLELGSDRYVVAVGTLEPRKNLPRLIAAFAHVATTIDDLHLVIAGGDGPAAPAVAEAIEHLPAPMRARVHRTGWLDRPARDALLASAAALAYPSLDEGFGFPVLEGFAHRVPVLAADIPALREVAGDGAAFADPTDVEAIAAALHALVDDAGVRARLVDAGTTRLATFSWTVAADAMADLYVRVAAEC